MEGARQSEPFHFFQYFARFPVWDVETVQGQSGALTRVELTDLRFGQPHRGSFHAIAFVKPGGEVLRSWFTYADGNQSSDADSAAP